MTESEKTTPNPSPKMETSPAAKTETDPAIPPAPADQSAEAPTDEQGDPVALQGQVDDLRLILSKVAPHLDLDREVNRITRGGDYDPPAPPTPDTPPPARRAATKPRAQGTADLSDAQIMQMVTQAREARSTGFQPLPN